MSELTDAEREALDDIARAGDFAGLLRGEDGAGLSIKAVSGDVARLVSGLADPVRVEDLSAGVPGPSRDRLVGSLILDGILEIEEDGKYLSGIDACRVVIGAGSVLTGDGPHAGLSVDAIRHGFHLPDGPPLALAAKLYAFNTLPMSARWRSRWPDTEAVRRDLGVDGTGPVRDSLLAMTDEVTPAGTPHWITWRVGRPEVPHGGARLKLYVGVHPAHVAPAFAAVVGRLGAGRVHAFKVGATVRGLLRPDKLIMYFRTATDLTHTARELEDELSGLEAHPVPFTSAIAGGGLLSRGEDPSAGGGASWLADDSWRLWVCNRLAAGVAAARGAVDPELALRFVLARLWLAGVDTRSWSPHPSP